MLTAVTLATALGLALAGPQALALEGRTLTFEQRVAAEEAVQRVYYSHQIGATKPFEEAVPREVLERKVTTYLKQSVALDRLWKTRITAEMLRAEIERIARNTRFPDRLLQVYQVLNDDPFVVGECFARPALVDRLSRNFFAFDQRFHAEARQEAEALSRQLNSEQLDLQASHPRRTVVEMVRADRSGAASGIHQRA